MPALAAFSLTEWQSSVSDDRTETAKRESGSVNVSA
jgi:hypothetical protein